MAKASLKNKKKATIVAKKILKKPTKKVIKKVISKPKKKVLAIPKGYHSITPYLIIEDSAANAINFYKKAFDAKENVRMELPSGKIAHAELKIGDSRIMLADACKEMDAHSPKTYGGSPVGIHLYVKGVDDIVKKAVKAGAKLVESVKDMFYGDRSGTVEDPYGHWWTVSTHIEDVTPAKMKKRAAEIFNKKIED